MKETTWETKLLRARRHVEELRERIDRMKRDGVLGVDTEQQGRERTVRLVLREDPPTELSAIIGDALHNTRSALDCLAFEACTRGAAAAGTALTDRQERDASFPIASTEAEFRRRARQDLPHATNAVIETVHSRQPYYIAAQIPTLTGDELAEEVKHHPLSTLARLSNIDKHRHLHLVRGLPTLIYTGVPDGVNLEWRWSPSMATWTGTGRWVDGSEIGRWMMPDGHEETPLSAPKGDVELVLHEHLKLGWTNVEVAGYLASLVDHVDRWVVPAVVQVM
jgi:hypothetical protein